MNDPSQRRRFPRIPLHCAVLVELLGDRVGEQIARTRNLSVGGCQFTCQNSYPTGSVVKLLIKVDSTVIEAVGRVAYATPSSTSFDLGVEFIFIRDGDRSKIEALFGEG